MVEKVSKGEAIAFRLSAHHLLERANASGLLEVAGRCGIQNSPPGSALLALHARVRDITRERVDKAVAEDKSLLQTWCMRGAPFFVPTSAAPVFTTGVLPPTEEMSLKTVLAIPIGDMANGSETILMRHWRQQWHPVATNAASFSPQPSSQ